MNQLSLGSFLGLTLLLTPTLQALQPFNPTLEEQVREDLIQFGSEIQLYQKYNQLRVEPSDYAEIFGEERPIDRYQSGGDYYRVDRSSPGSLIVYSVGPDRFDQKASANGDDVVVRIPSSTQQLSDLLAQQQAFAGNDSAFGKLLSILLEYDQDPIQFPFTTLGSYNQVMGNLRLERQRSIEYLSDPKYTSARDQLITLNNYTESNRVAGSLLQSPPTTYRIVPRVLTDLMSAEAYEALAQGNLDRTVELAETIAIMGFLFEHRNAPVAEYREGLAIEEKAHQIMAALIQEKPEAKDQLCRYIETIEKWNDSRAVPEVLLFEQFSRLRLLGFQAVASQFPEMKLTPLQGRRIKPKVEKVIRDIFGESADVENIESLGTMEEVIAQGLDSIGFTLFFNDAEFALQSLYALENKERLDTSTLLSREFSDYAFVESTDQNVKLIEELVFEETLKSRLYRSYFAALLIEDAACKPSAPPLDPFSGKPFVVGLFGADDLISIGPDGRYNSDGKIYQTESGKNGDGDIFLMPRLE